MEDSRPSVCRGKYDVNLLYYEDHLDYVLEYFKPILENQLGLHICLPQRDHLAGVAIADNITNSSKNSQYCVILFCKQFYDAEWNSFASHVALHGSLSQSGFRVIPVFVSRCIVDTKFKPFHHLDITEENQRKFFWGKLCKSLNISCAKARGIPVPPTIEEYYRQKNLHNSMDSNIPMDPPGAPPSHMSYTSPAYPLQVTPSQSGLTEEDPSSGVTSSPSASTAGTQTLSAQDLEVLKGIIIFVFGIIACYILTKCISF